MLFSKSNLAVRHAASPDRTDPSLCRVQFEPDGSTVAADGHVVMAVGPADPDRAGYFPDLQEPHAAPPEVGVGLDPQMVASVERSIPAGKHPALHFCQMTRATPTEVKLLTTDARLSKVERSAAPARRPFPRWRRPIADAAAAATRGRICFNGASMVRLLTAMMKAAPDPGGYYPVFAEFGGENDAIVLRAENEVAKQRVVAIAKPLRVMRDRWLEADEWERDIREDRAEERGREPRAGRARREPRKP